MKSRKMNRILSLLLAMVMVVGVFVVPTPDEVSAATKDKEIRGILLRLIISSSKRRRPVM